MTLLSFYFCYDEIQVALSEGHVILCDQHKLKIFGPCNEVHLYELHFIHLDRYEHSGKLGPCLKIFFKYKSYRYFRKAYLSLQRAQRQPTEKTMTRHLLES